jgi:hypothetical protein
MKDIIRSYSKIGMTSLNIFFPVDEQAFTTDPYHIRIYSQKVNFMNQGFRQKLIDKFRSEGILLSIDKAIQHQYQLGMLYYDNYGGYILVFKWDRNYNEGGCCIIV